MKTGLELHVSNRNATTQSHRAISAVRNPPQSKTSKLLYTNTGKCKRPKIQLVSKMKLVIHNLFYNKRSCANDL